MKKAKKKYVVGKTAFTVKYFLPSMFILSSFLIYTSYSNEKPFVYLFYGLLALTTSTFIYTLFIPIHSITFDEDSQSLIIYGVSKKLPTTKQVIPLCKIVNAYGIPSDFSIFTNNQNAGVYIKTRDQKVIKMINTSKSVKVAVKINELLKKRIDRYKLLERSTVPSLPDLEVIDAVMIWMYNKIDNWHNEYSIITSLPKPCQYVYSCYNIVQEVNKGGLNLLYLNQIKQLAQIAQEGFHAIGNKKLSDLMEEANKIYQDNKAVIDKYSDGTKENYIKLYNEDFFDDLDYDFIEEEVPSFKISLEAYIRKNEIYFGE